MINKTLSGVRRFHLPAMGSRRFFNTGGGGGGITTKSSSFLLKRDMFRTGDIPNLFRGRQTGGCVSSFVPHQLCNKSRHMLPYFARSLTSSSGSESSGQTPRQDMFWTNDILNLFRGRQPGGCVSSFLPHQLCNKNHMLPYFARALASSSGSESSGQTPRQEPTKKEECEVIRSSKIQRERCDEISSTKVSLNQSPEHMVHGMIKNSKTRCVLQWNRDTGYFEQQDVAAAAVAASHHARALASSSASQSSGQTPRQEPTKKKRGGQIIRSSKIQRERCDKISSTEEVSLNQFPGLMVHGKIKNSKTRPLLRMNPDTDYLKVKDVAAAVAAANYHLCYDLRQVPNRHVFHGSAYGWLFLTDDNLDMKFWNLLSGAEIQLPPVKTLPLLENDKDQWDLSKWVVYKAIFSANPSIEPRPVVLIIYREHFTPRLAFCKLGDKGWTPLEFPKFSDLHMDAIYHKGQFYVLGWPGYVVAFDIGRCIDDDDHSVKAVVVATPPKRRVRVSDWYLMVLDGELVRFELMSTCLPDCCNNEDMEMLEKPRKGDDDTTDDEDCCFVDYSDSDLEILYPTDEEESDGDETYPLSLPLRTYGIKIRRFDVSEKQWVKVESLGDKAVFLGYTPSFAVSVSDYPGICIPDSVYFNYGDCVNDRTEKPFYGMGVYNVKDKTVGPAKLVAYA